MNHDKVTELLKNYRAYKQAIYNYEHHTPQPSAGVANYSAMPSGSGAPELFFERVGKMADMGLVSALDRYDNDTYKAVVHIVDVSVAQVLDDNERYVIENKWLMRNRMELYRIAIVKDVDERTISRWHRSALRKLNIAFSPLRRVPEIEEMKEYLRNA